ncbi:DUF3027 domain-containing protein [Streptomyces sp. NBC_00102]|uniref:DUF3027 domain-containing protein n=1 Tax=Streptomyces sp. NBC_00102 TaxID=2975652 RepID=UPI002251A56E|nr:DUF3027 domain-containing protein [Streptomyces sp. NBC_00102]MCX5401272.1 DUF3027 domain-containing protein [Streptomyces sp. NBC_00102]
MSDGPWTGSDRAHNGECHARWAASSNRSTGDPGYRDEWYDAQCGGCRFWIALGGELGQDYGACTNSGSAFDGRVRFEHDGCAVFTVREDHSFG